MNDQKLKQVFSESLNIDISKVEDDLEYNSIPEWDSIAHMILVADIEDSFDIMLDTDEIIDMSSFSKAKEILGKHNIDF